MYKTAVIGTVILMFMGSAHYVRCVWTGKSNPALATWILMEVMILLSFWMYWESPKKSWSANIGVNGGMLAISLILTGVVAANLRYGTLRMAFDKVQQWCLIAGAGTVVLWFFTDNPLLSYVLVQIIGLIAYIATVKRLWNAKQSTEPLFLWTALLFAFILAVYPAWVRKDIFSWIYLIRTIPTTLLIIYLIKRVKRRMCRQGNI